MISWSRLIVVGAARALLISALSLAVWAILPGLWGWQSTTVSSDSMAPAIRAGDVVDIVRVAPADLRPGQVLLVANPDAPGQLRLHRLSRIDSDGNLILRGDANPAEDSTPVRPSAVQGVGYLRVPYVGLPTVWLRNGSWVPLVGLVGVAAILAWVAANPSLPRRRRSDCTARTRTSKREVAGKATAAGALALLLGVSLPTGPPAPIAQAAFAVTTANDLSSLASTANYPCLNPAVADSPFLLYRFNETSGTSAADSSGNGRAGTLQGGAATGRVPGSCAANASPALSLNGTTAYVSSAATQTNPNVFSTEIWFTTSTGTSKGGWLIGFSSLQTGASGTVDRQLYLTDAGALVFGVTSGGTKRSISAAGPYNDGGWHQAVATMSSAGMRLYVDGALRASAAYTTGANFTGYWRVGYDAIPTGWPNRPANTYFSGLIDNAAVYPTALTAAQVSARFAAGR